MKTVLTFVFLMAMPLTVFAHEENIGLWSCQAVIQFRQYIPSTEIVLSTTTYDGKNISVMSLSNAIERAFDSVWMNSLESTCHGSTDDHDSLPDSLSWKIDGNMGSETVCAYACQEYTPPSGDEILTSMTELLAKKLFSILKMPSFTIH